MAGKKGHSGRKGAGREFADFQKLWNEFTDAKVIQAIEKKEKAEQPLSIKERFLLRAYQGIKERDAIIFKKLFPDTNRLEGPDGGPVVMKWKE